MKKICSINPHALLASLCLVTMVGLPQAAWAQDAPQPPPEAEEFFDFDEGEEPELRMADPLEPVNRVTFAINDKLYRGVFKPVARGLRILPASVRISFSNFFSNLGTPVSAASALLQADLRNT